MTYSLRRLGALGGLLMLSVPFISAAAEFRIAEESSFRPQEQLADDLYLAGSTVTTAGAVTGDVAAVGGNVLLDGSVSADVLISGGTVTLLAPVGGDARILAGNVIVQSDIGGDLLAGGGQISLTGPRIGGDVVVGAGSVRVESPIMGDAMFGGGDVWINAPISGNVRIKAERVSFGPEAHITGNLSYSATKQAEIASSTVAGNIAYEPQPDVRSAAKEGFAAFLSLWSVASFFMLLIGSLFFGLFFMAYSTKIADTTIKSPLRMLGYGILFLIVTPVVSVLLMASLIAFPIGVLGMIGFAGALICAWLFAPVLLGSVLYRWWNGAEQYEVSFLTILIGVICLSLVGFVPILGSLAKAIIILTTLGAIVRYKWELAREWR